MELVNLFLCSAFICLAQALKNKYPILPGARARIRSSVTVPIGSRCNNQVPAYLVIENTALLTGNNLKYRETSEGDCMTICSDNLDFNNQNILCSGFTYDFRSRTCHIHRNKAKPSGIMPVVSSPNRRYYEKFCLPADAPASCGEASFFRGQQTILVGFAVNVTVEETLEDCVATCISHKDACQSSMYFYNEGECIMNAGSAQNHPEVYANEPDDSVVYFENGCILKHQIRDQDPVVIVNTEREYVEYNVITPASAKPVDKHVVKDRQSVLKTGQEETKHQIRRLEVNKSQEPKRREVLKQPSAGDLNLDPPGSFVFEAPSRPKSPQQQSDNILLSRQPKEVVEIVDSSLAVSSTPGQYVALNSHRGKEKLRSSSLWPVESEEHAVVVDNLVKSKPKVTEWEEWSECDRSVDGRRVRRRKCLSLNSLCQHSLTEVQWCAGAGSFNVEQKQSLTSSNSISGLSNSKVIVPSSVKDNPESQSGFSQWDSKCRTLNPPQPCQNGFKLGFQSRQCHASPFQCLGSFFRYCFMPC